MKQQFFTTMLALSVAMSPVLGHASINTNPKFMAVTDVHFNPYASCVDTKPCAVVEILRQSDVSEWENVLANYDASASQYKTDTNYSFLKNTLAELKQRANQENPAFVIMLGDYLAHNYRQNFEKYSSDTSDAAYQAFTKKSYQFLTNELAATFPNTNVYMTMGNNDSYQDDYVAMSEGPLFRDLSLMWSSLINEKLNQMVMRVTFAKDGYYGVDILPGKLHLIVLNSNLWVAKAVGNNIDQAAKDELTWLHQELMDSTVNHEKVIIAEHAPDTVDAFGTIKKQSEIVTLFKPEYSARYQAEIKEHADSISVILGAHYHMDWFQLINHGNSKTIMSGVPAISSLFGNNPGYKMYEFDPMSVALQNSQTYFYDVAKNAGWAEEYDFNAVYQPNCTQCTMQAGMENLQKSGDLAEKYKTFFSVGTTSQPITTNWLPYYWCQIVTVSATDYAACMAS